MTDIVYNKNGVAFDIDAIATDLNGKADTDLTNVTNSSGFRKLTEVYNNGTSGYKVYAEYNPSTGDYIGEWCEQWGRKVNSSNKVISFVKEFANINYNVSCDYVGNESSNNHYTYHALSLTTTSMRISVDRGGTNCDDGIELHWCASGYLK